MNNHREVLPEELDSLGVAATNQELVLVPVVFDGEERYALAAKAKSGDSDILHLLGLCFNMGDEGRVLDPYDGKPAGAPMRVLSN